MTVIYTVITNQYDSLQQFNFAKLKGIEYIVISDYKTLLFVPSHVKVLRFRNSLGDPEKFNRYYKFNAHRYLDYEKFLYIDANLNVPTELIKIIRLKSYSYFIEHPFRSNIIEELEAIEKYKNIQLFDLVKSEVKTELWESKVKNIELTQNSIFCYLKSDKEFLRLLDDTYQNYLKLRRDQIALIVARYRRDYSPYMEPKDIWDFVTKNDHLSGNLFSRYLKVLKGQIRYKMTKWN
ncbi:hypothetical protein N9H17_06400 [Schleiferiaceae bacterium]|nr:hypothetical protein [Schleiferiaceae bacterium]